MLQYITLTKETTPQGVFGFGLTILTPVIDAPLRGTEDALEEIEGASRRLDEEGFVECELTIGNDGNVVAGRVDCLSLFPLPGDNVSDATVETFIGFGGSEGCNGVSGFAFSS